MTQAALHLSPKFPVVEQADRPTPLAALPFRLIDGCLEWYAEVGTPIGPKRQPYRIQPSHNLFAPIAALMEQYRELERGVDALKKQRDDVQVEIEAQKTRAEKLEVKCAEQERRLERQTKARAQG